MRLAVNLLLPLAAPILLAGCMGGASQSVHSVSAPTNGPASDYPVVVGEPFTIGTTTYTPEDTMNYDAVGYALVGQGDATNVAASHKTLPLPSYIEVTELESGRTALIRVETRGPMRNDALLELTPAAAKQLGIPPGATTPVRIRRVNPPEADRAMLRAGEQAPLRMDTPKSLLAVLKRKLDDQQPVAAKTAPPQIAAIDPDAKAAPVPATKAGPASLPKAVVEPRTKPKAKPTPPPQAPAPAPVKPVAPVTGKPPVQAGHGNRYVQVGTFSTRERAQTAAAPLGAKVSSQGKYWLVRMGPLDSAAAATTALEKARKAGYRDAIVRRVD